MDEATLNRASEPFFTTKGTGKGTGLGLSMVDGLAAQSGGAIRLSSKLGQGTSVENWLPPSDETPGVVQAPSVQPSKCDSEGHRIMVVDDDPMIAAGTAAMIEDLGHTVIEAGSGAAALELLNADPTFDLIITDHAMPGMTGAQLIERIRRSWPTIPIVLASGYVDLATEIDPAIPRLSKPYYQADLAKLVAELIKTPIESNVVPFDMALRS
jgi:CheY-like chemotaxis protein